MNKMYSMSTLALMAVIALSTTWIPAQDTAVDETIASILNDVEAKPVVPAAMEPAVPMVMEPVVPAAEPGAATETTTDEETSGVDAIAVTANQDAVANDVAIAPVVDIADGNILVADPVATEAIQSETVPQIAANGSGVAVPESDGTVRVSMAFEESPFPDVVRAFREASGANIISGWTNTIPHLVSARLDNVEWSMGLSAIVAPYGLELKEEPRGSTIYIIREKVTVETELPRFTETFELKHAKAETVSSILQYTLGISALETNTTAQPRTGVDTKSITAAFPAANIVVVKGTQEQLESCRSIIAALDVPPRQVYIEARFARLTSSASKKLGMKWDSLANFGASIKGLKGGLQVSDATVNTFDYTTTAANRTKRVSATGVERASGYDVTKTTGTLIPEKYTGANLSGLAMEDLTWKKASGFGGVLSITDFGLTMSAFEQMDGVQIFSNPKIIVQNGTTAKVDMTTREPNVKITTTPGENNAASQTSSELATIPGKIDGGDPWVGDAFFSYGITLDVTPRISPTGLITVEIVPSISTLDETQGEGGYKRISDGNTYPIISVQRLVTTFAMGDGKTAVIGGLTETKEGNTDSGIPLLRKIPWIGPRLFGWKSREKTQYEIIVFVSVGIVDGTTIEESAGLPKNAVLGRGILDGSLKEPGDRTEEEMFNIESQSQRGYRIK